MCAAIKAIYDLVIAYVALFVFALAGWIATVVAPWFLAVLVPIIF